MAQIDNDTNKKKARGCGREVIDRKNIYTCIWESRLNRPDRNYGFGTGVLVAFFFFLVCFFVDYMYLHFFCVFFAIDGE